MGNKSKSRNQLQIDFYSIQMDKESRKSHSRPPLSICGKPGPMLLLHDPVKNYFSKCKYPDRKTFLTSAHYEGTVKQFFEISKKKFYDPLCGVELDTFLRSGYFHREKIF